MDFRLNEGSVTLPISELNRIQDRIKELDDRELQIKNREAKFEAYKSKTEKDLEKISNDLDTKVKENIALAFREDKENGEITNREIIFLDGDFYDEILNSVRIEAKSELWNTLSRLGSKKDIVKFIKNLEFNHSLNGLNISKEANEETTK